MTTLAVPLVHLNGTSKEALFEGYSNAISAVRRAMAALGQAYPHARDYYPLGCDVMGLAQAQHELRLMKLREVAAELEEIALAIEERF